MSKSEINWKIFAQNRKLFRSKFMQIRIEKAKEGTLN